MIEEARRKLPPELAGRVRFEVGDASALACPDGDFDLVVLSNMIPFFDELARVVAPGGTLVLSFSRGAETPIYVAPERAAPGARHAGGSRNLRSFRPSRRRRFGQRGVRVQVNGRPRHGRTGPNDLRPPRRASVHGGLTFWSSTVPSVRRLSGRAPRGERNSTAQGTRAKRACPSEAGEAAKSKWRGPDSNRRHPGFQPSALPAELPRRGWAAVSVAGPPPPAR